MFGRQLGPRHCSTRFTTFVFLLLSSSVSSPTSLLVLFFTLSSPPHCSALSLFLSFALLSRRVPWADLIVLPQRLFALVSLSLLFCFRGPLEELIAVHTRSPFIYWLFYNFYFSVFSQLSTPDKEKIPQNPVFYTCHF